MISVLNITITDCSLAPESSLFVKKAIAIIRAGDNADHSKENSYA